MNTETSPLIPVNPKFLEVFETFMDDNQKEKIRANNARQYVEGIIDLVLKEKIMFTLKPNEPYEGINWKRKIKILKENYDADIANKIEEIFRVGGSGSHFNGIVNNEDLLNVIEMTIHFIEELFIKYFLNPEHRFGSENIFTIFSMLPLSNRIYILEGIHVHYQNIHTIDRLSLAYLKDGDKEKAVNLLNKSFQDKLIDKEFYDYQLNKLRLLEENISELYERNSDYVSNPAFSTALIRGDHLVVGLPTSKNVFETARAVELFSDWFDKNKYPEFVNLFLCLMSTDTREYE